MKIIGICNNKGGVGKTTICLCMAGAFAQMDQKVLLVDMDQQGSLSSSFLPDIHSLSLVITDALRDDQLSINEIIQSTKYENIDIVPQTLTLVSESLKASSNLSVTRTITLPIRLMKSRGITISSW